MSWHGFSTRARIEWPRAVRRRVTSRFWHGSLTRATSDAWPGCEGTSKPRSDCRPLGRTAPAGIRYNPRSMSTLSYRTAGESHGKALITLVEGLPAGVPIDSAFIDNELRRRQGGYGRGGRQKIETDRAEFLTGVRLNKTIASPVTMLIPNKDSRL